MRPARRGHGGMRPAFQSTHPVWDATAHTQPIGNHLKDFNPRIPYGMRPDMPQACTLHVTFQSTHPVWDATLVDVIIDTIAKISIHASRMGCDSGRGLQRQQAKISIHASRMGCDHPSNCCFWRPADFNPRIPYGMRQPRGKRRIASTRFQSTHPVWDATRRMVSWRQPSEDFNPRIPYGMRPAVTSPLCKA